MVALIPKDFALAGIEFEILFLSALLQGALNLGDGCEAPRDGMVIIQIRQNWMTPVA